MLDAKRIEMKSIDGSDNVKYSAVIGDKKFHYATDGVFNKHLNIMEWQELVLNYLA